MPPKIPTDSNTYINLFWTRQILSGCPSDKKNQPQIRQRYHFSTKLPGRANSAPIGRHEIGNHSAGTYISCIICHSLTTARTFFSFSAKNFVNHTLNFWQKTRKNLLKTLENCSPQIYSIMNVGNN